MLPRGESRSFVHALAYAALMTQITIAAHAADTSIAIYDGDSEHLWNRLYEAIAVRTEGGIKYGVDNSEPYRLTVEEPAKLITILDEFLHSDGQDIVSDGLKRALLLNDIWAAFDLAASPIGNREGAPLQRRLARIIGRLRLDDAAISALPDNCADAVKSATFASDYDAEHPENPFLPADLVDANGPWVQIRDGRGELVAPAHVENLSGRSTFLVFIRCPGGTRGDAVISQDPQPLSHTLGAQAGRGCDDLSEPRKGAVGPVEIRPIDPAISGGYDRGVGTANDSY
jgi:hypothetical protein